MDSQDLEISFLLCHSIICCEKVVGSSNVNLLSDPDEAINCLKASILKSVCELLVEYIRPGLEFL